MSRFVGGETGVTMIRSILNSFIRFGTVINLTCKYIINLSGRGEWRFISALAPE